MKKCIFWIVFVLIGLTFSRLSEAQSIDVSFDHAAFFSPEMGSYVETYLSVYGNSLVYKLNNDNFYEATVEATLVFKNANQVKEFRKFKIQSPALADTTTIFPDLSEMQRILIPEGVYNFQLQVRDLNAADTMLPFKHSGLITVNFPKNQLSISDMELVEQHTPAYKENIYVKGETEYKPYVSSIFPKEKQSIKVYAEVYNAAHEFGPIEDFLVLFHIESVHTSKPIKEFSSIQKEMAHNVNVIFKEISIAGLPAGNYYLVIELRDKKDNPVLSAKKFFQRESLMKQKSTLTVSGVKVPQAFARQYQHADSLVYYLNTLRPISDSAEMHFIDQQEQARNIPLMQQFLYQFWKERNQKHPELAWSEYLNLVSMVDQQYKTDHLPGFKTDRGRILLQYGAPINVYAEKDEPGAKPYEIWHYYQIANQSNLKFIFVQNNNDASDFILVHSNLMGQKNNPDWEQEIYSNPLKKKVRSKAREYIEEY
ncbi:MAG: GWxTD domain-containing protein [Salinivirgaceae bacterium]